MLVKNSKPTSLWIFGYGSLIWNPGFEYAESRKAYAQGWARRMWQGNTFHRGDTLLPGRVATLVRSASSEVSGLAFHVVGAEAVQRALEHLDEREVQNGYVYKYVRVQFESADRYGSESSAYSSSDDESSSSDYRTSSIIALTCIAAPSNAEYLGPARITDMARQIGTAKGLAGPNHEYVLKLAEHIRSLFPHDEDTHLFSLERHVREVIRVAV